LVTERLRVFHSFVPKGPWETGQNKHNILF
jgi:hypothetical protein